MGGADRQEVADDAGTEGSSQQVFLGTNQQVVLGGLEFCRDKQTSSYKGSPGGRTQFCYRGSFREHTLTVAPFSWNII